MRRSLLALCLLVAGCTAPDDKDKIAQLEKQTKELQTQVSAQQRAVDLDLQAKCSKDAKAWFNQNYQRDKDTTYLGFVNHYNAAANKCYILIQYKHWINSKAEYLASDASLYDVYENDERASLSEAQVLGKADTKITVCEIGGDKKKDVKDFDDCFQRIYAMFMVK